MSKTISKIQSPVGRIFPQADTPVVGRLVSLFCSRIRTYDCLKKKNHSCLFFVTVLAGSYLRKGNYATEKLILLSGREIRSYFRVPSSSSSSAFSSYIESKQNPSSVRSGRSYLPTNRRRTDQRTDRQTDRLTD